MWYISARNMFRLRKVHSLKNANIWKREVNHIVSMKKKSENDFRFLKNSAVGVGTAIGLSVYFSEGNSIFGYTVDTSKVTSKSKQWNGVHLVLLANGVVFGMWQLANLNTNWVRFMADHFTSSYQHTIQGRYHTLLTSAFSHRGFLHFGINMFMLAQFGNALVDVTDARMRARRYFGAMSSPKVLSDMQFYALYGASAFASSISSNLLLASRGMPAIQSLGASGAVNAILTIYCLLYPKQEIALFGLIHMTAQQSLILGTCINVGGVFFRPLSGVDYAGHLGGQAIGVIAAQMM